MQYKKGLDKLNKLLAHIENELDFFDRKPLLSAIEFSIAAKSFELGSDKYSELTRKKDRALQAYNLAKKHNVKIHK